MKTITKNTDYAIRALMALAGRKGQFVSAREIASQQKVPYPFLRRILHGLIKNGLIQAKEGAGGGVRMHKNPAEIKIVDVINIFQGKVELTDCMFRGKSCHNRSKCVLRKEIKRIEGIVVREFGKMTIQIFIDKTKKL
jgi:Rrf2 family protein